MIRVADAALQIAISNEVGINSVIFEIVLLSAFEITNLIGFGASCTDTNSHDHDTARHDPIHQRFAESKIVRK